MRSSRRTFLQGTGIAAALTAFPPSIRRARRALAIPAFHETGTIKDVKHIVILMQENRAFDHYFGSLVIGSMKGQFAEPPKGTTGRHNIPIADRIGVDVL